jgi:anti-anti-sigma factor
MMRHPLCEVQRIGDELWFFGEIDASNAGELAARAVAELQAGAVGLDLSRVRFFAVAGLRIVLAAQASARSLDGGLPVVCSPEMMRTLQVCRLTDIDGLRLTAANEAREGGGTAQP